MIAKGNSSNGKEAIVEGNLEHVRTEERTIGDQIHEKYNGLFFPCDGSKQEL